MLSNKEKSFKKKIREKSGGLKTEWKTIIYQCQKSRNELNYLDHKCIIQL